MSYVFDTKKTATLKFTKSATTYRNLNLAGINATITSADAVVNGVQQLLGIVGQVGEYDVEDAMRTVTENVRDNS